MMKQWVASRVLAASLLLVLLLGCGQAMTLEEVLCKGDNGTLAKRLQSGLDPNITLANGRTPLTFVHSNPSCQFSLAVVILLVEAGANVNGKDENGDTPLMSASAMGPLDSVALLLDKGADANTTDAKGHSALMQLGDDGQGTNLKIAKLLVDAGADVNYRAPDGMTAYGRALQVKYDALAGFLKSVGAKQ
jgi:ankyrin repeat protein